MAGLRKLRGKYYVRVFLPGGREKLIPTKTGDRKLAEAYRRKVQDREFLVKAKLAEDVATADSSLFKAVESYLADCRSRLRGTTFENYELGLRNMNDCWGDIRLSKITGVHYTTLRNYLAAHVGPVSVNIRLGVVRTFLHWLVTNRRLDHVPGKMSLVKVDNTLPKFFTPKELNAILSNVDDPQMEAIFRVLAETGLRRGEIFKCTLDDGYLHLRETKGHRDRLVAIHLDLVPDFLKATERPRNLAVISRAFSEAMKKAAVEVKGRSLHCLRHTFALREYHRTGDIYLVRGLLGHRHVATTEIYLQFPQEYLDRVFGAARQPLGRAMDDLGPQVTPFQA